jgi:hypothetical protein
LVEQSLLAREGIDVVYHIAVSKNADRTSSAAAAALGQCTSRNQHRGRRLLKRLVRRLFHQETSFIIKW